MEIGRAGAWRRRPKRGRGPARPSFSFSFPLPSALSEKDPLKAFDKLSAAPGVVFSRGDAPLDLAATSKEHWRIANRIVPPPAIRRYLDVEDRLTTHAVNMMCEAIEKQFGVVGLWFITPTLSGTEEDGDLRIHGFALDRDRDPQ